MKETRKDGQATTDSSRCWDKFIEVPICSDVWFVFQQCSLARIHREGGKLEWLRTDVTQRQLGKRVEDTSEKVEVMVRDSCCWKNNYTKSGESVLLASFFQTDVEAQTRFFKCVCMHTPCLDPSRPAGAHAANKCFRMVIGTRNEICCMCRHFSASFDPISYILVISHLP